MPFAEPTKKPRLMGVDAARGIALIGLMIVHILPDSNDDHEPTILWIVFSGHSAALLALLAGVSLALSSGGQQAVKGPALKAARGSLAVRAALITALGLIIAYADTPAAIILAYYGVMFMLAIPVLGLSTRSLVVLAVGIAVIGPITVQALRESLPEPGFNPTVTTLFTEPGALVSDLLLTGDYPALPFMAYICAGLAIGRLDLMSRPIQFRVMFTGLILTLTTWLLSALLLGPLGGMGRLQGSSPDMGTETIDEMMIWGPEDFLPTTTLWWQAILAPYSTSILEVLNTTGTSMAVLGAVLLLARVTAGALTPLAALGSMTLTLYSAHLLVLATGFLEDQPNASLIVQVVIAAIFALLWRRTHDYGPLEGVIASATKRTRASLLRTA